MCFLASLTVISRSSSWFSLPKLIYTESTAVSINNVSAPMSDEILLATKSLSITASTPFSSPFSFRTGIPPPPPVTTTPSLSK